VVFLQPALDWRSKPKDFLDLLFQALNIPLLGIGTWRACLADNRIYGVMAHVINDIVDPFSFHDFAALFVNYLALIVHHVIVLDNLLAHFVITRFNLFLRGFNRL